VPVVFKGVCVVNGIFEIVLCVVDVWFNINKLDVVNSRERRVVPWLASVDVDTIWVEVSVVKMLGKLDE